MRIIFLFFISLSIFCCSSENNNVTCVSFDTRQCMGDPWSEVVDERAEATAQAEQMMSYLLSIDINVIEIKVNPTFHEVVCEACFVCPIGPRFYIKAMESEISKIEALELLNYSVTDCSQF